MKRKVENQAQLWSKASFPVLLSSMSIFPPVRAVAWCRSDSDLTDWQESLSLRGSQAWTLCARLWTLLWRTALSSSHLPSTSEIPPSFLSTFLWGGLEELENKLRKSGVRVSYARATHGHNAPALAPAARTGLSCVSHSLLAPELLKKGWVVWSLQAEQSFGAALFIH